MVISPPLLPLGFSHVINRRMNDFTHFLCDTSRPVLKVQQGPNRGFLGFPDHQILHELCGVRQPLGDSDKNKYHRRDPLLPTVMAVPPDPSSNKHKAHFASKNVNIWNERRDLFLKHVHNYKHEDDQG